MKKKPYLEQNISNHQLDKSDQKANTNTSPEIKNISQCGTSYSFRKKLVHKQLKSKTKQMKKSQI